MNAYLEMKEKYQEEINKFPIFFAFNNKQFDEGMNKLGLKPSDTDKVYSLKETGGFYRRTDATALYEMFKRHDQEMNKAIETSDSFIYDMFDYELANHEYSYTHDISDTLAALDLTEDQVRNDKRLLNALNQACKAQRQ